VVRNPVDEGVVGVVGGGLGGGLGGGVGGGVVGGGGVGGGGGGGIVDADGGVGDWWPGRKSVREKMISDPPRCNPL
jgi:hypothetical protein